MSPRPRSEAGKERFSHVIGGVVIFRQEVVGLLYVHTFVLELTENYVSHWADCGGDLACHRDVGASDIAANNDSPFHVPLDLHIHLSWPRSKRGSGRATASFVSLENLGRRCNRERGTGPDKQLV